tara:strand:- start:1472 stop:1720 length:249 start_codon:yes stop_codon:yes gene_type:complete
VVVRDVRVRSANVRVSRIVFVFDEQDGPTGNFVSTNSSVQFRGFPAEHRTKNQLNFAVKIRILLVIIANVDGRFERRSGGHY